LKGVGRGLGKERGWVDDGVLCEIWGMG
jgi:hypothetical protein